MIDGIINTNNCLSLLLNNKYKQLFKLTTGIITCFPEKEKSLQKNNIVYALHVFVDQPIGLHSTRYRLNYHYHNETWMVKAFKDLLTE